MFLLWRKCNNKKNKKPTLFPASLFFLSPGARARDPLSTQEAERKETLELGWGRTMRKLGLIRPRKSRFCLASSFGCFTCWLLLLFVQWGVRKCILLRCPVIMDFFEKFECYVILRWLLSVKGREDQWTWSQEKERKVDELHVYTTHP